MSIKFWSAASSENKTENESGKIRRNKQKHIPSKILEKPSLIEQIFHFYIIFVSVFF